MHLSSFAVDGPAVGQAFLIRSTHTQRADRNQQRRLEPAAVLVAAFNVHGGRPEALIALHGGKMGGAGIKPAVQSIGFLGKVSAAAVRADKAFGQKVRGVFFKPGVAAFLFEDLRHGFDALFGADGLFAIVAVEHRDRQAPAALARNAPVAALADHGAHTLLAPCGKPAHILACGNGLLFEGVDRAEPLRRSAEDDGFFAAPAVRVAVGRVFGGKQHAAFFHVGGDDGIGFLHIEPGILARIVCVAPLVIHGDDHLGAVLQTGHIVDITETGRRVDAAGTGIDRDIVGQHQQRGLRQEGMVCQHILKERAGMGFNDLVLREAALLHDGADQFFRHDIHFTVRRLDNSVSEIGVERDAEVAGQRPGGCCPDQEEQLFEVQMAEFALVVVHGELHIHGRNRIVMILDFSLGKGGLVVVAPVDRLQALVDMPVLIHLSEDTDFVSLEAFVHGEVGVLPVTNHTKALEAVHLPVDILLGIIMAGAAEVRGGHFLVVQLLLLDDGRFNGHAVVIPAGDIRDIAAAHHIAAVDEILEGFVQRMAHVNVAVGKRRSVVQGEQGLALILLQLLVIKIQLFPVLQHLGLALRKTGPHGKIGLREVQRCIIVFGHE